MERKIKDKEKKQWVKDTALFLSSQTLSLFGSSLVQYAILWYITLSTKSGTMMTLFVICGFVPTFLISPISGVLADRYDRKKLIIAADLLIAGATLLLAILFMLDYEPVWLLFFMAAVRALGTGIQSPAVGAVLPSLVPQDKLTKVNGISTSLHSSVALLSPILSAALMSAASMEVIFFVDVVTAAAAVFILIALLKIPVHEKALTKQTTSYFADLKLGFIYIKEHKFLKSFFLFFAMFFFLMAPGAFLTPLQVARSFGEELWRLTAIEVTFSVGMIAGGALMAYWGGFKNRMRSVLAASLVIGICTFALGMVPVFFIYLSFMSLYGVTIPLLSTPSTVMLQEKVESDYLGRVFGVMTMISTSVMPIGMMLFGPLADVISIEHILMVTGVVIFILGLLLAGNKVLKEAGEPLIQIVPKAAE